MNVTLNDIIAQCPEISELANYWFIRTEGGTVFEAFIATNSIAIGYSKVSISELDKLPAKGWLDAVKARIAEEYPDHNRPGLAAGQIEAFCKKMKKGDYVIIPSFSTKTLALGVVADDKCYEEELSSGGEYYEDFSKRRKVRWLKRVERAQINPKIFGILATHQTVVSANNYARWIDPLLYDFFKKGNSVHYVMDIAKKDHINARVLFGACVELLELADVIAEADDLPGDSNAVDARVNLNSPGTIEFISNTGPIIAVIALVVVLLNGGGLKLKIKKLGLDLNLSSGDGIIRRISQYLNDKSDRKTVDALIAKFDDLKIEDSGDVVKILKAIRDKPKK